MFWPMAVTCCWETQTNARLLKRGAQLESQVQSGLVSNARHLQCAMQAAGEVTVLMLSRVCHLDSE
jgi:hypothetical protein